MQNHLMSVLLSTSASIAMSIVFIGNHCDESPTQSQNACFCVTGTTFVAQSTASDQHWLAGKPSSTVGQDNLAASWSAVDNTYKWIDEIGSNQYHFVCEMS
jgi:hypothetical protein